MPKPKLRLHDWLFGAGGKRRLLAALLSSPSRTWTQAELARAARVHPKGSIDEHLLVLIQLGLVAEEDGTFRLVSSHPLAQPLSGVMGALSGIQDAELNRPP